MSGGADRARTLRALALLRLALLPVILAGERLVDHPGAASAPFGGLFAAACVYSLAALATANHPRGRQVPDWWLGLLDLAFIAALVYTSGGPFSQLRFAFFLVPLMAAAILTPRMTLLVSALAVSAFATIAVVYPTDGVEDARTLELAQLAYLAVAALAAWLLAVVLDRSRAAIEELAESRRQLVAQALDAEDRERRRLAEVLHDEAMQSLLTARQELTATPPDLERARTGIDRAVADLRTAIFDLHPHLLGEAGLGAALQAVADGHRRHGAPAVRVDAAVEGTRHDGLLFSIARELIANATHHAAASQVEVTVTREQGDVVLLVADDGLGIAPDRARMAALNGHIGLASCRERAAAAGGSLTLEGGLGRGTTVRVVLPDDPPEA
ncbi:MAG: two-component system, NarL family, sensor kinase [Gaiellaceae bacterium]|nr:two-component system, NarL family, sensor kinase [Gaiellaceae bacterium]